MPALRATIPAGLILPAEEVDCHLARAGRDLQIALRRIWPKNLFHKQSSDL